MSEIAERLKQLPLSRRWSQREFAHESGVDPQTISSIENGRVLRPKDHTSEALAEALGVTVFALVGPSSRGADGGATVDRSDT